MIIDCLPLILSSENGVPLKNDQFNSQSTRQTLFLNTTFTFWHRAKLRYMYLPIYHIGYKKDVYSKVKIN